MSTAKAPAAPSGRICEKFARRLALILDMTVRSIFRCSLNIGRRPQFRLLAKYIHKTVRTDTDRARCDWLLLMIKY